jgi:glycosyltransferase involved in cell wall biosynthesis
VKLLYIHQYFKFPDEFGGTRSYWIAKGLIKNNHKVVVISTKNGLKKKVERITREGIIVIYLNIPYSNNMGIFARFSAFVNFMFRSTYYALKEKKVDLIYATSTPLTVGFPALITKWFSRTPYVFEVRDLWPEVPIQMGALKNSLIKKAAILFEKTIYNNATHIIALSPGMKSGVMRFVKDKRKVSMVPNMSKIDEFYPRKVTNDEKIECGIDPSKFNCIHFGAMGIANGLEYIIKASKLAYDKRLNFIQFVFLGEGVVEDRLKSFVKQNNLGNVTFLGPKPLNEVSSIVNACDLSIVSFADIEVLKTNSPNKLFDSLSAGKPIIVNSSGWTKDIVEENNCGFYVDVKAPEDLIEKIQYLYNDKKLFEKFSKNSRILAENKYDKTILVPQVIKTVEEVL